MAIFAIHGNCLIGSAHWSIMTTLQFLQELFGAAQPIGVLELARGDWTEWTESRQSHQLHKIHSIHHLAISILHHPCAMYILYIHTHFTQLNCVQVADERSVFVE